MLWYSIFSYFVVGIIIGILVRQAVDKTTSICSSSKGFDTEYIPALIFAFIFAPITLPFGIFIWAMYKISTFIYNRFMV